LKRRVFTKAPVEGELHERMALLTGGLEPAAGQIATDLKGKEVAFALGPVPQVVVDRNGLLVQANDRARSLFGITPGDLGRPLYELEVSYRPVELRPRIESVQKERRPEVLPKVRWGEGPDTKVMQIELVPLEDRAGRLFGVSVTFTDLTGYEELQRRLEHANQELETAMEELQSTNEELETTNEELQSTNEELETTNEELQSTNEELETMNEELQSTNEELQAINEQARDRSDEVQQVNAVLDSIMSGFPSAVVVLDRELRIHGWNARAQELWGLTQDEVRGRPFLSLDIGLEVQLLASGLTSVLRGSEQTEGQTIEAVNRRGQSIVCRVRCSPLLGQGGEVDGVIVTMEDEKA